MPVRNALMLTDSFIMLIVLGILFLRDGTALHTWGGGQPHRTYELLGFLNLSGMASDVLAILQRECATKSPYGSISKSVTRRLAP